MRHEYVCQTCGRPVIELDGDPTMTICPSCLGHVDTWADHYHQRREAILNKCWSRMATCPDEYKDRDVLASRENLLRRRTKEELIQEYMDGIEYAVMRIMQIQEDD